MTASQAPASRPPLRGRVLWTPRRAVALSLLPFVYIAWLSAHLYVDVPFNDQFELVPRLDKIDRGTLTFYDVWRQHNEHRPMFPILVMLGLAEVTGWNIGAEIGANVLLGAGIFVVCASALRRVWPDGPALRYWLLPLFALVIFSPDQWENWLWGWQIQIFMGVLAALAGVRLLSDPSPGPRQFAAALACGVVATYSFAAGLTFWVVGAVPLWFNPPQRRRKRLAAWCAVGGVTIASYFYGYHGNPGHGSMLDNFSSAAAVRNLLVYVAKYLGTVAASYDQRAAAVVGAAGLAAYAASVIALWGQRHRPAFLFPATAGLYTLASAVMTAMGRAGFGSSQATASRYTTLAAPLWVAVLWLGALWLATWSARASTSRARSVRVAAAVLVAAFTATVLASAAAGTVVAGHWHEFQASLRGAFVQGTDDVQLARLFASGAREVKQRRMVLKMLHMSVFRED